MLGFYVGGFVMISLVCFFCFLACEYLAENHGNFYATWPVVAAGFLGLIMIVGWCFLGQYLYEPICSNGHRNDMTAEYCIVCGVDLEPNCECGHVWGDETYCPKCGGTYEK